MTNAETAVFRRLIEARNQFLELVSETTERTAFLNAINSAQAVLLARPTLDTIVLNDDTPPAARAEVAAIKRDAGAVHMTRLLDVAQGTGVRTDNGDVTFPLALASEYPVSRYYGTEILGMDSGMVRLERLNDGANVLFNHHADVILGSHVQGSAMIGKDRVVRAQARLSPATQAGRDAIALYNAGHLTKASVGYNVHKVIERVKKPDRVIERELDGALFQRTVRALEGGGDKGAFHRAIDAAAGAFERSADDDTTYRITDWEPFETSLVSTPADPTVGIGRSQTGATQAGDAGALSLDPEKPNTVSVDADANPQAVADAANEVVMAVRDANNVNPAANATTTRSITMPETTAAAGAVADTQDNRNAQELEQARINAIRTYGKGAQCDDRIIDHWIRTGTPLEKVADDILKIVEERSKNTTHSAAYLGLEAKDVSKWSLFRAISAIESGDWTKAGLELACSRAVQDRTQKSPSGKSIFVPMDVLQAASKVRAQQRDLNVASASQGGYLVDTQNQGFVDLLRNSSVVFGMGARRLSGLQGNVTIPKQTAASTGYWLASETSQITESTPTFGQIALSPKTCGAYNEISRQLLLQSSPDAEQLVMSDLAKVVGLAIDSAALSGTGSAGQPTGLITTSGIGSVTGTSLAYAGVIEFQTDVATANALGGSLGYVTTPVIAGLLKGRVKYSNTASPLWEGRLENGMLDGYNAMSSNQVPSGDLIFGDWSQMVVGEWGILEIAVNPTANFQAAIIGVRALYTVDIAVRIAAAFSLATSVT